MLTAECFLELRHLGEVEVPNFHRRDNHVEGFFPTGAHRSSHSFDVRQHMDEAFVEAEIAHPGTHLSVLDEECAVTGHAGKNLLVGIDFTNVPETAHQDASIGRSKHLLKSLRL